MLFLFYQHVPAAKLSYGTLMGTFAYGLRLDASAAAYICLLPFVLLVTGGLFPRLPLQGVLKGYSVLVGVFLSLLLTADLELYRVWGFRLDETPLQYLNSPTEMAASAGSAPLLALALALFALLSIGWLLYKYVVGPLPPLPAWFGRGRATLASLLYVALLVLPLRGGIQQIPINQSDVYFSSVPFANHAAVNAPWNFIKSLQLQTEERPTPPFMPEAVARQLVAEFYPRAVGKPAPPDSAASYLNVTSGRPNVLFIILESFTGKLVGCVGGERGVTPNLDSLARTGVLFDRIYAAGDRSQKGLVALLSGYPNQPTTSIIRFPRKTEHLPHLCRALSKVGYRSRYYYGGELAFANMKSYLQTAGYEQFTERSDFARADQNSKWGAHDGVLFQRLLGDLRQQPEPFFVTAFTLSSHEPFDVPMAPRFPGTTEADLFRNSVHYTDAALGEFLRAARQQPWYARTLLVLVADHGHPQPGDSPNDNPAKFHIPLLLAGGALRADARGRVVSLIGSQTDVAATLLHQLRLPAQEFTWSRDLLAPRARPFAYYSYTDGFGVVTPAGTVTFDNVARQVSARDSAVTEQQLTQGKAFEQLIWDDFRRR